MQTTSTTLHDRTARLLGAGDQLLAACTAVPTHELAVLTAGRRHGPGIAAILAEVTDPLRHGRAAEFPLVPVVVAVTHRRVVVLSHSTTDGGPEAELCWWPPSELNGLVATHVVPPRVRLEFDDGSAVSLQLRGDGCSARLRSAVQRLLGLHAEGSRSELH